MSKVQPGRACVDCAFSQSIPNMRADDAGKVFCTWGKSRVHANGLCSKWRAPTQGEIATLKRKIFGASAEYVKPLTWRESVAEAKRLKDENESVGVTRRIMEVPHESDPELF